MSQPTNISIDKLIPNVDNSRFLQAQKNVDAAIDKLLDLSLDKILTLAIHIAENGMDPSENLIITPHPELEEIYVVLEGNRRLCALWILLDPSRLGNRLDKFPMKKATFLQAQAKYITAGVIEEVSAAIEGQQESAKWIKLKHTGENDGAGRVSWDAQAIRRHNEKYDGVSDPSMVLLSTLVDSGFISDERRMAVPITTFERVIRTTGLPDALGYHISKGQLYLHPEYDDYSLQYLATFVMKLIEDRDHWNSRTLDKAKTRRKKIRELAEEINAGQSDFPLNRFISVYPEGSDPTSSTEDNVPNSDSTSPQSSTETTVDKDSEEAPSATSQTNSNNTETVDPDSNDAETTGDESGSEEPPNGQRRTRQVASTTERDTLMSDNYRLRITETRINDVYKELQKLKVSENPNAIAVLWRLFLEFSANHYCLQVGIITMEELSKTSAPKLDSKIKSIAKYLKSNKGWTDAQVNPFLHELNDPKSMYCLANFHQLVHNHLHTPTAYFLKSSWNNFEPLISEIWGKK